MKARILMMIAGLMLAQAALGCGDAAVNHLRALALRAVAEDQNESRAAVAVLRARGPVGLQALLEAHAEALASYSKPAASFPAKRDAAWQRLSAALDAVGQQRDCHASRLYWFTDLEQAKHWAKATGKPILSLRLLGKLDEEFSCANSRFFRTTLYANAEVSQYLRDHFVLHWKSVRPVPKVTIDFGDGRKLERTITGNSIHYILDSEGRVVDALPGLYGPKAFLTGLGLAEAAARRFAELPDAEHEGFLRQYHADRLTAIGADWSADLAKVGSLTPVDLQIQNRQQPVSAAGNPPPADAAARIAVPKRAVEMPILKATAPRPWLDHAQPDGATDDATWAKIGALHAEEARLDDRTKLLMRRKHPTAFAAGKLTMAKVRVEDPLLRTMRNLERSIAEDTVRNEYLFHARIHEWLGNGAAATEVERLNARVYAELFLTPDSDPWLGLVPRDTYTALENDGMVTLLQR